MKTHWLFGRGPDKLLDFKREINEETDCSKCIHREVCDRDMEKRCENYMFGTSEHAGCQGCLHKYTRYDKDSVPCFSCPWFEAKKEAVEHATYLGTLVTKGSVRRFWLQKTESFEDGAPQRENYLNDFAFDHACVAYAHEWRRTYHCEGCDEAECPQCKAPIEAA